MAAILVAMSGGVDSSLTAALLCEQGHRVAGVTMLLWDSPQIPGENLRPCCTHETALHARRVCAHLGISHHLVDYRREFRRAVINYFIETYRQGQTPNPCIACNRTIKFRFLREHALEMDFDMLATGHYARIEAPDAEGTHGYRLRRGVDLSRDQSYVLAMLQQHELASLAFPLGELTKHEVRAQAQARRLPTANQPESQDICFIPDNDYRRFLHEEAPDAFIPGPIVHQDGHLLGTHQGLPRYTIGQRKGLGIAYTQPLFVTAMDTAHNTLVVGPAEAVLRDSFAVENVSIVSGQKIESPFACMVQVRAHAQPFEATVLPLPHTRMSVCAQRPQPAITPGQTAVFYDGDRVIGCGVISTKNR